ncbi:Lactoylglutathione lyase [Rubellimicrobium thermophilum DSM 16684]|uniref:Lactoylglutathione lyase n=1 Tax=Rubellimicrobium thermophilum DSM 16684 TaxID=1123069 RepID=S9QT97_9RHOB|nr:VOC family protein [Rubellimicrobium thermophilum]EPX82883.1 Lactoylglutathione lyase [Rubellimicrobium thermophilum DSM 16684]
MKAEMPKDWRDKPHSIHHVNFPTTDPERTKEWYGRVFGLEHQDVSRFSNTKVLLLTRNNFDLHFTPCTPEQMVRMAPFHFAIEVYDWDGFLAHLKKCGVRHTKPVERPQNRSKFCYIHDPDGTMIELVWHGDREDVPAWQPGDRPPAPTEPQ